MINIIVTFYAGEFLGYHHPSGEVHILDDNKCVFCHGKNPVSGTEKRKIYRHNKTIGQDNPLTECIVGDVPNIFVGSESNYLDL